MTAEEFECMLQALGFCGQPGKGWLLEVPEITGVVTQYLYAELIREGSATDRPRFQLTLISITPKLQRGENFGVFSLAEFGEEGDIQMRAFLGCLDGAFMSATGKKNPKITRFIRDNNIKDLLS